MSYLSSEVKFNYKTWKGDTEFLTKFADLLNQVYGDGSFSKDDLIWKHHDNPIGKSIITFAENENGDLVAARAFWKMYNDEVLTYQPCDTVTRLDCRKKGLFSTLTKNALSQLHSNSLVINFPNSSSAPGYLKLGWKLYKTNSKRFTIGLPFNFDRRVTKIDEAIKQFDLSPIYSNYLAWRFSHDKYTFYVRRRGILIFNGNQSAYLSLSSNSTKYNWGSCSSFGYLLGSKYSFFSLLMGRSFALKAKSQTFYFSNNISSAEIESYFSMADINFYMDTF